MGLSGSPCKDLVYPASYPDETKDFIRTVAKTLGLNCKKNKKKNLVVSAGHITPSASPKGDRNSTPINIRGKQAKAKSKCPWVTSKGGNSFDSNRSSLSTLGSSFGSTGSPGSYVSFRRRTLSGASLSPSLTPSTPSCTYAKGPDGSKGFTL